MNIINVTTNIRGSIMNHCMPLLPSNAIRSPNQTLGILWNPLLPAIRDPREKQRTPIPMNESTLQISWSAHHHKQVTRRLNHLPIKNTQRKRRSPDPIEPYFIALFVARLILISSTIVGIMIIYQGPDRYNPEYHSKAITRDGRWQFEETLRY